MIADLLKKNYFDKVLKYAFLVLLSFTSLYPFLSKYLFDFSLSNRLKICLIAVTSLLGIGLFWRDRKEIVKKVHSEKEQEKRAEEKRKEEFKNKYPKINNIPIVKNIFGWMYKEGWVFSLGLGLIILTGCLVYTHNINYEFREDEYQVIGSAAGYYYTSEFYVWDWLKGAQGSRHYDRAWPHTWFVAQSYRIFGISEFSSRIVSVLFGLIFLVSVYFVTKYFWESKKLALLTTVSFVFYSRFIDIFRYTRMYAVLIPIFLLLFYFIYRSITESRKVNIKLKPLGRFIENNLDFNWKASFLALLFLILNYFIHINSLVLLPVLLLFIIYLAIVKKERKYIFVGFLGLVITFSVFLLYYFGFTERFLHHISFFGRNNRIYLKYLTSFPFIKEAGITLLLVGLIYPLIFSKEKRSKLVYSYLTVSLSLVFFIWIADRYSHFYYISHIVPISIILILFSYYLVIKLFDLKVIKIFLYCLPGFLILFNFYNSLETLYADEHSYGRFREAYRVIVENYNPEEDVLFGQYLRTYYLRELGDDLTAISMRNKRKYDFFEFLEDLGKCKSGWVTWETRKGYHIQEDIIDYIEENFEKYHGQGVDNTNVEVYYFNQDMVKEFRSMASYSGKELVEEASDTKGVIYNNDYDFVQPAEYNQPGYLEYEIDILEPVANLSIWWNAFVLYEGNYIKLWYSNDAKNYELLERLEGSKKGLRRKGFLDIPWDEEYPALYLRVELFANQETSAVKFDSRITEFKVYSTF
ncbi:MAG: glycosyltransferase family 39 protein [Patescibacteria group bacterium]|nr:glycosyltransferase family 39 protein [Patescibacteria group bacterium]